MAKNSKVSYDVPSFGVSPAKPGGFKDWMKPESPSTFSGVVEDWDEEGGNTARPPRRSREKPT